VQKYACNEKGNDYAVGDIHGEFPRLEHELVRLNFNPNADRLFSVGDLIDRGPDSRAALDWLARPWFHPVRGNHEAMLLEYAGDGWRLRSWLALNGGTWWLETDPAVQRSFLAAFRRLPLAIEIETSSGGRVGIVHADVPAGIDWDTFVDLLESNDEPTRYHAVWSRERIDMAIDEPVPGIDRIYCGHTPIATPVVLGNVYYIDTGACFGGKLTLLRF
jgi:serine/threonine protein phosphatase 1